MTGITVFMLTNHLITEEHQINSITFQRSVRLIILIQVLAAKRIATTLILPSKDYIIPTSTRPILANILIGKEKLVKKTTYVLLFTLSRSSGISLPVINYIFLIVFTNRSITIP